MNPIEIIIKKRNGQKLSPAEIDYFVQGISQNNKTGGPAIPDYQIAAWAMAVYFQGMDDDETTALTLAMANSGQQLDFHTGQQREQQPAPIIVDKHSSGGIGDKTTLVVAPIVAACGLPVGKMSGRGLGFTGGTLDKLESITGWQADISQAQFRTQLEQIGLVIAGQTADLAPADKYLYALRDVTGTVDSLPLIASSIMSKKLAAGADAIVLDVKCGGGAFMTDVAEAEALARLMVAIGTKAGRKMTALMTQMNQPLGDAVGHALEVNEAIVTLQGDTEKIAPDFLHIVEKVSAEMLLLGKSGLDVAVALHEVRQAVSSGAAFEKFCEFVEAQGGDVNQVCNPKRLPQAPVIDALFAGDIPTLSGERITRVYVQQIDARAVGMTVVNLGGGRRTKTDAIDHSVGITLNVKVGDSVEHDTPLCWIHAATHDDAQQATAQLKEAFVLSDQTVEPLPVILKQISS
ncbi:MAG: thymidine phosphorylase [Chloroflexota bacterium]